MADPAVQSVQTEAVTEAGGARPEDVVGPFYTDPTFWVAVGFLLFVGLLWYLKVHKTAAAALDARSAKIAHDIDEAARLRADAEALLAQAQAKLAAAEGDAAGIVDAARRGGAQLAEQAARDLEATIARKSKAAEDRITAAERAATAAIRAAAVDKATAAARRVIAEDADRMALTDAAISELDRRL